MRSLRSWESDARCSPCPQVSVWKFETRRERVRVASCPPWLAFMIAKQDRYRTDFDVSDGSLDMISWRIPRRRSIEVGSHNPTSPPSPRKRSESFSNTSRNGAPIVNCLVYTERVLEQATIARATRLGDKMACCRARHCSKVTPQ